MTVPSFRLFKSAVSIEKYDLLRLIIQGKIVGQRSRGRRKTSWLKNLRQCRLKICKRLLRNEMCNISSFTRSAMVQRVGERERERERERECEQGSSLPAAAARGGGGERRGCEGGAGARGRSAGPKAEARGRSGGAGGGARPPTGAHRNCARLVAATTATRPWRCTLTTRDNRTLARSLLQVSVSVSVSQTIEMSYTRVVGLRQLSHLSKFYNYLEIPVYSSIHIRNHVTLQKKDVLHTSFTEQSKHFGTKTSEQEREPGYFLKMMRKAFAPQLKRSRMKIAGSTNYENIVDVIDYNEWFRIFKMSDTLMSWFLITELHVWMLMVRCMAEGDDGRFVRNSLVESLWNDVSFRVQKLGVRSSSQKRKNLDILSEQFQAAIISYDEGLLGNDMVLAGAIWRRFFSMEHDNAADIETIVKYIRRQVMALDDIPKEKFFSIEKSVAWLPLITK
ncbi:ubiquinol-cytochrome c reductase complex assembly factor 1 [Arctopsyche grandis]|uniref:ubiquinol-cytochrome c reductase complex assembly factor 1 n=1 Tax=Arctopsyche grandis TaxID=121162 RepID=UPI00406D79AC